MIYASLIIYLLYVIIIYIKYKPSCISESYYKLKNGNLFTVWTFLVSLLIFPSWVECSPINFQFLPFLSLIALGSVGMNPKYLSSDRLKHILSALISVIISLIWNIVIGIYIIPLILLIIGIIIWVFKIKNKIYWIECLAFLNIYLSIILS